MAASAIGVKDSIERLPSEYFTNANTRPTSDRKGKVARDGSYSKFSQKSNMSARNDFYIQAGPVRVPGSAPTIPSKYLTIVTNNNEQKGFQGSSRRFQYNTNDTPGPGYYMSVPDMKSTLKRTSDSKKGYGGFASSACRSDIKLNPDMTPGAGTYNVDESSHARTDKRDFSTMYSSAFQRPIAQNYEKENTLPAPNTYDVTKSKRLLFKNNNVCADSAFKSHTKREFIEPNKDAPAPNTYDVKIDAVHDSVKVPFSSFKTTTKRNTFISNTDMPGPGEYRPYEPNTEPINRQLFPRRHYLAISAPAVPLAAELPTPGPGAYEVRDSKEPVKKYMSGSVFVSSTSRWINAGAQQAEIPGPGQYSPNNKVKQSFLYNLEKKWV